MKLPDTRTGKAAVAAMVLGTAMLVVAGVAMWGGDSSDPSTSAADRDPSDGAFEPYQGQTYVEDLSKDGTDNLLPGAGGAKGSGPDPFASESGDKGPHKVVITFTSDGALYAGWRYRNKGGEGIKVASKTLTVGRTVTGGLPVAQAAVQVLGNSTYATCTISVDGVKTLTQTAKGQNSVTVCTS